MLRAVNLGPRNKVPMAALRELCVELGFGRVDTYIASGNLLFHEPPPDAATLEQAIAERFGVRTTAVLRTAAQLRSLANADPFGDETPECNIMFLRGKPPAAALRALAEAELGDDRFARVGPDLAVMYARGFHAARLSVARAERVLGVQATVRNWRTVGKLAELASA